MKALTQFIPLQAGQTAHIMQQKLINTLLDQVGYEPAPGGYIIFTEDLLARAVPITGVDIQLVVADLDQYSDFDLLPLSADMAGDIVQEVYQKLLQTPQQESKVDSTTEEPPNKR